MTTAITASERISPEQVQRWIEDALKQFRPVVVKDAMSAMREQELRSKK